MRLAANYSIESVSIKLKWFSVFILRSFWHLYSTAMYRTGPWDASERCSTFFQSIAGRRKLSAQQRRCTSGPEAREFTLGRSGQFEDIRFWDGHNVQVLGTHWATLIIVRSINLTFCDFHIHRIKGKERLLDKRCGTLPYVAPEILIRPYNATAADIWSCGIILVAMLAGGKLAAHCGLLHLFSGSFSFVLVYFHPDITHMHCRNEMFKQKIYIFLWVLWYSSCRLLTLKGI